MKTTKILALVVALCMVLAVSAFAADVTWKDYQDYLVEAAGGNAPDLDEFKGQVEAIGSWDEMPLDESPWDQLFTTLGLSTWEEFVANDGVGATSLESGSMGGASGESSGEASSDEPSGEASGEASGEYTADEDGYKAYLKDWVKANPAVQGQIDEFLDAIDAGAYADFPLEMCFTDQWFGFAALSLDEFIEAGGVAEIPAFDPNLAPD